jgi:response regulator NasT
MAGQDSIGLNGHGEAGMGRGDGKGAPEPRASVVPLRVLVADDEALVAVHVSSMLKEMGHDPIGCVGDGQRAVDAARAGGVDLIVMDVNMPVRDGLSATEEVVREFGLPVVLLTAYSDRAFVERARQAGVLAYVTKPASADQLRVAIDIAHARALELRGGLDRAVELERRLEDRKVMERAKWLLVDRYGVNETDAWALLQKSSRATRTKLGDVARRVLETNGELPGAPSVRRRLGRAR